MILPPDYDCLATRLAGRGSEDPETRLRRLSKARAEVEEYKNFRYAVVNRRIDTATDEVRGIVLAERRRTTRCAAEAKNILETFPHSAI